MPNVQQALHAAQQCLANSDSAKLDSELLLAAVLDKQRTFLRAFPETSLSDAQYQRFTEWLQRRQAGEPIAYILQDKEFWSLSLQVNHHVLVPRPETECLVEAALQLIPEDAAWQIADLGTGSGAIALALASERPLCQLLATDIDAEALAVAEQNAEQLHLHNVRFQQSDWGAQLAGEPFTMIVSNPPYIANDDPHVSADVKQFQPGKALFAEKNGLAAIQSIIEQAQHLLLAPGYLLLEHGFQQQADVVALLDQHQFNLLQEGKDLAGLPRFVVATRA